MTEKRIQFSNIVFNQLPAYVREEFPLVAEFLSEYYRAQEFQGAPIDLIQNIDKYIKIDEITQSTQFCNIEYMILQVLMTQYPWENRGL
jgi:hypothetical protein